MSDSTTTEPSEQESSNVKLTHQEKAKLLKEKFKAEIVKDRTEKAGSSQTLKLTKNPFVYEGPLWTPRQFVLVFLGIVLVPLKILAWLLIFPIVYFFMKLSISFDFDPSVPMSGWRRLVQAPIPYLVRIYMFCLGFYWVETVGKPCSIKEARIVVCAPHSTVVDTFYIIYAFSFPSAISKIENLNLPLSGTAFKAMQAVAVDRKSRNNKNLALDALSKHAKDTKQTRHLMVFPEGTCTNRSALITFKRGAFVPGEPVQPVCLEWPDIGFDLTWTAAGPNRLALVFHLLCQPFIKLKVHFLPVYVPNEEEKVDPELFAKNVRAEMAKVLNIPVTSHSYEDMFLAKEAKKLRISFDKNIPFELHELTNLYSISLEDAKTLLSRYASIYRNQEYIDGPGLAKILGIPYTGPVQELFDLLKDENDAEGIDFRKLLIGVAQISKALNTSDLDSSIELVWDAITHGADSISWKELYEKLSHVFSGFTKEAAKTLFKKAGVKNDRVDYQMFKDFIKERPELLFVAVETIAARPSGGRRLSVLKKPPAQKLDVPAVSTEFLKQEEETAQ